jgi:multiple sugar transport system permease protein
VLGILFFTTAFTDFIWPLAVMTDDGKFPVALGLPMLLGPYSKEYGAVMAGSLLNTLPIIVVFLIAQRRFIKALTSGAVKG